VSDVLVDRRAPRLRAQPSSQVLGGIIIAGLLVLCLFGASGLTAHLLFQQPTNVKYAVTTIGPLCLLLAAMRERPIELIVGLLVVMAPFAAFRFTFHGIAIPALVPLAIVGAAVAVSTGARTQASSALRTVAPWIAALLVLPIGAGAQVTGIATAILTTFVVAWLVARAAETPSGLRTVLVAVIASAGLQALIAIWEFRTGHSLNLYNNAPSNFASNYFFSYGTLIKRPTGSFFDPISLGNVLAVSLPLATSAAFTLRGRGRRGAARCVVLASLVIALALILTFSRMSWIGAAAGIAIAVLLLPHGARAAVMMRVALAAVALVVGALAFAGPTLKSRYDSIFHPTSLNVSTASGDKARLDLWSASLSVAAAHPIAGVGFDNLNTQLASRVSNVSAGTHAHSTYFQLLAEGGLVFGGGVLVLLAGGLRADVRAGLLRNRGVAAGLAGGLIALAVCCTTDYTIRYEAVAAFMAVPLGLVAAVGRGSASGD
jgi:O-antigen ligase